MLSRLFSRSSVHTPQNAAGAESSQDAKSLPVGYVRAARLRRSIELRSGNPAFTVRAVARHLGINEKIVRLMLRGERPVAQHHVAALPSSLREEVVNGTPSERLMKTGVRLASGRDES